MPLLTPITLGAVTLANRVVMGAMHTGLEETGDWDRVARYYAARAAGGVGLIITAGLAPNDEGAAFPGAAQLRTPSEIADHRKVTQAVHAAGGKIAVQILHAGRYAAHPQGVAPSALRAPISPFRPREMSEADIEQTIADFVATAVSAQKAGYDGVEVMGSEGYLLNEFLARRTNRRSDAWGGDLEGRMRLPLAIVRGIRAATGPDFAILFRLSLIDLVPDGCTWDETLTIARALQQAGVDALNSGIGWHESRVPTIAASVPRGAFVDLTARLRAAVDVPVIASNRINTPELAAQVVADGAADMVSMARPLLADPDFVAKLSGGAADLITPCIACNQACLDHIFSEKLASCLINPLVGFEGQALEPTDAPARIAVVGGGPAGIMAAVTAADRGHHVTLFEQSKELGGQLRLAAKVPGKEEFKGLLTWFAARLAASSVDLRLGATADAAMLADFDHVILATGLKPRKLAVPQSPDAHVLAYDEVLSGRQVAGARVAVVGAGGIGFDVASFLAQDPDQPSLTLDAPAWRQAWGVGDPVQTAGGLAEAGPQHPPAYRQITMLQRTGGAMGRDLGKTTGWVHRAVLKAAGVKQISGVQYRQITDTGIEVETDKGPQTIPCDTVVVCAGQIAQDGLVAPLLERGQKVHVVGGAADASGIDAKRAIAEAVRLARHI